MLNPYYFYNTSSTWSAEESEIVTEGVFSCVEQFYSDLATQNQVLNVELNKYKDKQGAFSRALATIGCESNDATYDPVAWWSNYGIGVPCLQKIAMRILSLTTSSSGCERNWSAFEGIHTKKRNRLDTKRMNNLVYVKFNARLMNKKNKSMKVEALLANEATHAQSWIVEEVDDDEDDEIVPSAETTPNLVNEASNGLRKSARLEEMREIDEEDFVSDGTEDDGDDDDEEFELDESNMEHEVEIGDVENEEMDD